ncbi:NAD(P)H-hydrate dehydratase [Candidatus Dependentiae bacterium]|nr:NAD(P)H-hydrate dehydratase [Candidatus Dependentiae bacterium]
MKEIVSAGTMREIDRHTIESVGIPGIVLMEQAAIGCFNEIKKIIDSENFEKVIIAAGSGNNGGDGFAVCRHLVHSGIIPELLIVCDESKLKSDALTNFKILKNLGIKILKYDRNNITAGYFDNALVIDALLGTGITGKLKPEMSEIINLINASNNFVVSIDIPSGLSENQDNISVKADITLSIGFYKDIFFSSKGIENTGKIKLIELNFFKSVLDKFSNKIFVNEILKHELLNLIPERNSNKSNSGKILVIAGSEKYSGAAVIACQSAVETGAGIVYCLCEEKTMNCIKYAVPEVITLKLDSVSGKISFSEYNKKIVEKYIGIADVVLTGCGLDISDDLFELVKFILQNSVSPVILDADGINNVAGKIKFEDIDNNAGIILTPHPGEFGRLTGLKSSDIQNDRINASDKLKLNQNSVLVLKGKYTIISDTQKKYVNFTGNSLLSIAGSGDSLAGLIAGYTAKSKYQKLIEPVKTAVFLHGAVADFLKNYESRIAMKTSDINQYLNKVIGVMLKKNEEIFIRPF